MDFIKIVLDNYYNACYPGQTIAGRVECKFSCQTNLRAVRIEFKGRAKTKWVESESYYDEFHKEQRSRDIAYYAEEPYFDATYNLVQGGENFSLPRGKHRYPFSYILPARLPSSFEGPNGSIRYYIKATVDRPWKFDYEDKFALNVVSPLDLNYIPGLREPIATSVDKTMCSCWCNDSGALTFNMSLPASGFVPGQEVNIGAYVQNMTNVNTKNVKFKIVKKTEFITHHPSTKSRYDEILVASCMDGGIGAHGEKSWTAALHIPPEPILNLIPCNIINIRYFLTGEVIVPCPHTNLNSEVQVMMGTVPLTGVSMTFSGGPPPEIPFPLSSGPTIEGTRVLPPLSAPYPGGGAPYPPGGGAPYPPGGNTPYPPGGSASYPPGGDASAPAPLAPGAFGGAPYPSGGFPYPRSSAPPVDSFTLPSYEETPGAFGGAPYPPSSAPAVDSFSNSLPSYEETQKLKEKMESQKKENIESQYEFL